MPLSDVSEVRAYLANNGAFVNRLLDRYLPGENEEPRLLHTAMRYSVLAPGKRLRPILAFAANEYCGGDTGGVDKPIHFAMVALETVHAYSLIHDDLPCMDDDDLRRGIPTCHMKFGEAVAVLAGDALHVIAFHLMARTGSTEAVKELAEAIGTAGMIGGQMADVEAEGRDVTKEEVIAIHRRKTGALIRCSLRVGAMLADASPSLLEKITLFGERIGLAFQIIDDVLDIEGNTKQLGKNVGSDSKKQKATYPGAVGVDESRHDAVQLISEAVSVFEEYENNILKDLAMYIGQRDR